MFIQDCRGLFSAGTFALKTHQLQQGGGQRGTITRNVRETNPINGRSLPMSGQSMNCSTSFSPPFPCTVAPESDGNDLPLLISGLAPGILELEGFGSEMWLIWGQSIFWCTAGNIEPDTALRAVTKPLNSSVFTQDLHLLKLRNLCKTI